MSDLILLPNIEALVTAFGRAQVEVTELVGDRVVTVFGKNQVFPAIRVTQFGDAPTIPRPLVHSRFDLQIEAFGGPKAIAWRAAETFRAALVARLDGRQTFDSVDAIVTRCTVSGLRDAPDDEFTPAKPRYLFTTAVWARTPRTN